MQKLRDVFLVLQNINTKALSHRAIFFFNLERNSAPKRCKLVTNAVLPFLRKFPDTQEILS